MKRITLLCLFLMSALPMLAQRIQTGNLTVFSEDGTKFYLELNGERYNDEPLTNVRVEELPNPYYSCKIVFENPKIASITKKNLTIEDVDGILEDVTYRIKNKKGKRTLNFYSSIPAEQNMVRPRNTPVYVYGHPHDMYMDQHGVIVTQTETVTIDDSDAFGMNVNVGGFNVNMSAGAGSGGTTTTTTTTTTTGGGYNNGGYNNGNGNTGGYNNNGGYGNNNGYGNNGGHNNNNGGYGNNNGGHHNNNNGYGNNNNNGPRPCRNAMGNADFEEAKKAVKDGNFDDTKVSIAQQIMMANCLNTNQITEILKLINFEESRLELAKFAYDYCTDKNNYYKLGSSFNFDSSKNELSNFVKAQRK